MMLPKHFLIITESRTQDGFSVTTTAPNETLTINSFGVSEETTIVWGDGLSDDFTGTALRTHQYAVAGTFNIRIGNIAAVTTFDLRDNKVTLNSRDIRGMVNVNTFTLIALAAGTFNSSDISTWSPSTFRLLSMPLGYVGTFNSSDISTWSPSLFLLGSMPLGYVGTFNSSDISTWNPSSLFQTSVMPSGYVFIFADPDFNNFTGTASINISSNNLTQDQVDTILFSIYGIGTSRTASSGTITLGGNNAAPSGTLQPAVSCPVDTNTPGKEVADELLNDGCALGFNVWATVNFTA